MSDRPICKSADHLFVPIIEVSIPLLRCIHCNVFAYHDTVKQLAKNRRYQSDVVEPSAAKPAAIPPTAATIVLSFIPTSLLSAAPEPRRAPYPAGIPMHVLRQPGRHLVRKHVWLP